MSHPRHRIGSPTSPICPLCHPWYPSVPVRTAAVSRPAYVGGSMRRLTLMLAVAVLAGPASRVDGAVLDAAGAAAPGATLDLLVSLDRPAGSRLRALLAGLGTWSNTFRHVPVAAVRLPVANL